jgi:hypothetical protein
LFLIKYIGVDFIANLSRTDMYKVEI